jgi:hypothetical protein
LEDTGTAIEVDRKSLFSQEIFNSVGKRPVKYPAEKTLKV